jgi:putative ABC transport system ATP-binding protein
MELRLENIRKTRLGSDGRPVEILQGISLVAAAERLTVIIGPSGGGKSTLIRLPNRLEDPDSGRILLDGREVADFDPLELRRVVGLVPQKPFMFAGTVLENLQRPFAFRGGSPPPAADPVLLENLALCRLDAGVLPREARTLSIGEQQRVSLARLLVVSPRVLLLDEPTSALDRPTGDRLADTLREVCRSRRLTLLMVTHDLRLAERVADQMAYLEAGRILEEGAAADLLNRPRTPQLRRFLDRPAEVET